MDEWAYDLYEIDPVFRPSNPDRSPTNEDYYSWGRPLIFPSQGTVRLAAGNNPDELPFPDLAATGAANQIQVFVGGGIFHRFGHLMKDTVFHGEGESVQPGDIVGLVGNSGRSTWPHLHWDAFDNRSERLPIYLKNVRVAINPVKGDPWSRDLDDWSLREGTFVSRIPPSIHEFRMAAGQISMNAEGLFIGGRYVVERSRDLTIWTPHGHSFRSTAKNSILEFSASDASFQEFYRLTEQYDATLPAIRNQGTGAPVQPTLHRKLRSSPPPQRGGR